MSYIWVERIKSSYCFDLYNYLDKSCYILHIYQQQKLHVTDLTNRDGHDFACDGHDIHMQVMSVTQNCDGPDRDGTKRFSIITLNVDESWCPFWCIWTHKHIILQLPRVLTNNNTVFRNAIPFGHDGECTHVSFRDLVWFVRCFPRKRTETGIRIIGYLAGIPAKPALLCSLFFSNKWRHSNCVTDKNVKFWLLLQTIEYFELWNIFRWPETNVGKYNQKYNHRHLNNIAMYHVS